MYTAFKLMYKQQLIGWMLAKIRTTIPALVMRVRRAPRFTQSNRLIDGYSSPLSRVRSLSYRVMSHGSCISVYLFSSGARHCRNICPLYKLEGRGNRLSSMRTTWCLLEAPTQYGAVSWPRTSMPHEGGDYRHDTSLLMPRMMANISAVAEYEKSGNYADVAALRRVDQ